MRVLFAVILGLACAVAQAQFLLPFRSAGSWTGSPITLSLIPTRTNCVAPCSVFFDATGTTATGITYPFHDMRYVWSFGDTAGGATWSTTGNSKNSAWGPVAAHVFETAGSYTVTLTVFDGTNTASTTQQITVTAADTYYSTTNTRCYSTAGTFTGCPAEATQVTDATGDFDAAINADLAAGRRLLFRKGETWTASATSNLAVTGPWTIGAFGSGALPVVNTSAAGITFLTVGAENQTLSDGRVMDLNFNGLIAGTDAHCLSTVANGAPAGTGPSGTFNNLLLLRMECHDVGSGITVDGLNKNFPTIWSGLAIVEVVIDNVTVSTCGFFGTATQFAMLGSTISDIVTPAEHVFRSMWMYKAIISDNSLSNPRSGSMVLALRAPDYDLSYGTRIPVNTWTEYVVASANILNSGTQGSANPLEITVSETSYVQRSRNILVERNWITGGTDATQGIWAQTHLTTFRNNIFDLSASGYTSAVRGVVLEDTGSATYAPDTNWIYNNTMFYNGTAASSMRMVHLVSSAVANTTVSNNLGYSPNEASSTFIFDGGTNTVTATNSSDAQIRATTPNFVTTPPVVTTDYRPTSGYAVNGGTAVPNYYDFFGAARSGTMDIGAVNP